uniref:Glycine-rich family protein n=1 Tax=Rhizophora mucronata TaxID=61149 RepID=A0A2P2M322_RHIMU
MHVLKRNIFVSYASQKVAKTLRAQFCFFNKSVKSFIQISSNIFRNMTFKKPLIIMKKIDVVEQTRSKYI